VHETATHDARLTLTTAAAAAAAGAVVATYAPVVALETARDGLQHVHVHDVIGGGAVRLRARAVVNAAGPWADELRRLTAPGARPLARLSRGVHAVLALPAGWRAGVARFDGGGTAFAMPWQGVLLVGATDAAHDGPVAAGPPAAEEVRGLLDRLAGLLPSGLLHADRILHAFAGLRVLPAGATSTARASRRHVVAVDASGVVTVAGGKLTTHRQIALDALAHLPPAVRPRRRRPRDTPLGTPCSPGLHDALRAAAGPEVAAHLARLYGAGAAALLARADHDPQAFARVHPDGPDVWAQVAHARDSEWALTAADVVERRTTLARRGLACEAVRDAVARGLASGAQAPGVTSPRALPSSSSRAAVTAPPTAVGRVSDRPA
jgi:glycerol-3-phosphate dehydrogenase